MATFKAVILKGSPHVKMDGTTNIKIRLTHNRSSAYISTDLFINPDNFASGWAQKGKNKAYINKTITGEIDYYQGEFLKLRKEVALLSAKELKDRLCKANENERIDFLAFADGVIAESTEGTLRWHKSAISKLRSFQSTIYTDQIDLKFIEQYERYLQKNVGDSITNYLSSFRTIFKKARLYYNDEDRGIIRIPQYPFSRYQIPARKKNKSSDNCLSIDELKYLRDVQPATKREQYARDMVMLMFYLIGINGKDLFYLKKPVNGRVKYDRFKTGREYSIKLEPEAIAIIEQYEGEDYLIDASDRYIDHRGFVGSLNLSLHGYNPKNDRTNLHVDGIFKKKVTTNWLRHSWATLARNTCRIDKGDVALCLGHVDPVNRVTDMYLKIDLTIIDDANRKVLDLLK